MEDRNILEGKFIEYFWKDTQEPFYGTLPLGKEAEFGVEGKYSFHCITFCFVYFLVTIIRGNILG